MWTTPQDDIKTRSALLKYYNSECLAHVGYIFTLILIFVGLFEIHIRVSNELIQSMILSSIISSVFTILPYLVLRTLLWGWLANSVVHIPPLRWEQRDFALMHRKCAAHIRGYNLRGDRVRDPSFVQRMAIGTRGLLGFIISLWFVFFFAFLCLLLAFPWLSLQLT